MFVIVLGQHVYPALLPLMRTPRLPVFNLTDPPADLNGLAPFAERRKLLSALVSSHFKHSLLQLVHELSQDHFLQTQYDDAPWGGNKNNNLSLLRCYKQSCYREVTSFFQKVAFGGFIWLLRGYISLRNNKVV